MGATEVIPATTAHAEWLAGNLSEESRRGLEALGVEPIRALLSGLGDSAIARTILIDGEPAFVGGVVTRGWGGQLWFLTSEAVVRKPKAFMRGAKRVFDEFKAGYQALANITDARNERTLRLAKHFGFEFATHSKGNEHRFLLTRWEAPVVHRS